MKFKGKVSDENNLNANQVKYNLNVNQKTDKTKKVEDNLHVDENNLNANRVKDNLNVDDNNLNANRVKDDLNVNINKSVKENTVEENSNKADCFIKTHFYD